MIMERKTCTIWNGSQLRSATHLDGPPWRHCIERMNGHGRRSYMNGSQLSKRYLGFQDLMSDPVLPFVPCTQVR